MTEPFRIMLYGWKGKMPEPTTEEAIRTEAIANALQEIEEDRQKAKEERMAKYLKSVSSLSY